MLASAQWSGAFRHCQCTVNHVMEPLLGQLTVPMLTACGCGDYPQRSFGREARLQLAEEPFPLLVGEHGRVANVPVQFHAGRGLVHVLPARAGRAGHANVDLSQRYLNAVSHGIAIGCFP
jgi:hypothetical protein